MLENDAQEACGPRHSCAEGRRGHGWGRTQGEVDFHGGRAEIERSWVRERGGREVVLRSWERAITEDWLGRWALNLMLINVSSGIFGGRCDSGGQFLHNRADPNRIGLHWLKVSDQGRLICLRALWLMVLRAVLTSAIGLTP
jgi:hypothetical protein